MFWPLFGKPRAANAPRAAPRKPDGFAVWTSRMDAAKPGGADCIRMSRPLDPRRSYGDFVAVSPDLGRPPAVTVAGDELCVVGIGFTSSTVTLLHGLPAADGSTLEADEQVAFQPGSKPVYVGFAGSGVILPREDADGLGLETVNVSRLHLEVWRVPDRNLVRKEISAPDPTPEGQYDYEEGQDGVGSDGRRIWSGDMDVRGTPDQRAVTVFPLGAVLKTLEPGAYMVKAADASGLRGAPQRPGMAEDRNPARARRWVIFTDMALQAYDGSDALDVTVRSLKSAKAMGGVRVALVGKDGGELASVASDVSGRAHFARALLAGEAGAAPARVMAYGPRGDFTVMDLERAPIDLSKQDVSGRAIPGARPQTGKAALDPSAAVDGFLYADRGIYRPGETVHLVALLRDRLARSVKDRRGALVIRRPSGLEFARYRFAASPTGSVNADAVLPGVAPRGVWKASLEMDGAETPSGEVSFQVEDFVPQRLAVTLAAEPERPVVNGETRPVQVAARFLYGAVAASLPVRSEARVIADPNPFPAFKDYRFGDQQKPFAEKLLQGPPSVTDGAGHAVQNFHSEDLGGSTQPLMALFTASVFEPGGRPVSEETSLKVRLAPLYIGVKTTTAGSGDEPVQTFEIIAVDAFGRRVASNVHYKLISERWNYDWYEQGGRWAWRRTSRDIPVAEGLASVGASGAARVSRRLPWGDYRLELDAGGARTVIRQSSGWSEPADGVEPPDAARVSAVRTGYQTGDTVEIRVQAPFPGEAEVAVATDRLIASKSASVSKDGSVIRLKTDAGWGAGAYVLVTVVQPRDPVSSPKPRRALGLVYIPLEPPGRKLSVAFATPQILDSKTPVTVPLTVKGLSGERAHVTLAAVDEGVLRLTHQKNPDPIGWYFGKRAFSLAYRDDYGRLLDPNLGAAGAVNFGGDEFGGAALSVVPIKTVALWSGVVETDAQGHATIRLPPGDFNGQLRLVAVAWTDKAVGAGATEMTVRQPVVAELSLPRFLAPGDRAQATLELDNVAGKPGAYRADIFGTGGFSAPPGRSYTLALGQRIAQHLDIAAPRSPMIGSVELKATGPGFAADRRYPLQTRLGWGKVTRATSVLQKPGEAFTPQPALLSGFAAGGVSMTVSYSPFRGFDPAPIAAALSTYPYGCSEQLVSTAYPLLYVADAGAAPKLKAPNAALNYAVAKLLDREALDGSFGLWRVGDGEADPWLGAYIVDFLLEAKAHGANVPEDALARALQAMKLVSKPDGFSSVGYEMQASYGGPNADNKRLREENARRRSRAAAYALYDMAKAGQGDLARLRWFHDVGFRTEASPLARAQVGAALAAMGDRPRAHDSFVQAVAALGFKDPADWYQSPLRDLGGVIALAYEAGETGIARSLQGRLEDTVKAPDQLNTQEQGHLLRAAHAMLAASGPISIQASGVTPMAGGARYGVGRLAAARLVNTGRGALWRTVTVSGLPTAPPAADAQGLRLEKRFLTLDGAPANLAALKQGERMIVRLSGQSGDQRSMLTVIDDALPAGLEIEAVLRPSDAQGAPNDDGKVAAGRFAFLGKLNEPSLQEKRDDRYVAALRLDGAKPFVLAYVVRAVTPGDFFAPGAAAANMYRPAVNAHTAAGRLKIAPATP
ncbi:alpha-2-macroglobulin [Phenylobacterium sp.]|uniref:alpha-2-macroglobulin family protein n=1 Tax=Phenylobacterium sp. TaxID=1871053 RepID=UPI002F3F3D62